MSIWTNNEHPKGAVVPLRDWLLKRPDWLDHETAVGLIFAVKTFAASLLALYVAFWAGLDDPRWSFLTVFIVSQPDSGLVLAKSFYRILGTIAGLLVAVALIFGLAQHGELFVAAVSIWIGLCNFAARAVRNFASYGFQLAGYTVAIVGIPAALEPSGAYPLVVARPRPAMPFSFSSLIACGLFDRSVRCCAGLIRTTHTRLPVARIQRRCR
jgi:Fusaric acid resistance protein family